MGSILYCLIAIVCLSLCLKLKTSLRHTYCWDSQIKYTQHCVCSTRMGEGALVVTEPHFEFNAGLIVIFRSSHPPLFDWKAWSVRFRSSPGSVPDEEFKEEASRLAVTFWGRIGEFVMRSRTGSELSDEEKALWIQSGLAVSPLMGTCLQYSFDFCLAWALIGEWTSKGLFSCLQGPLATTWARGCLPSKKSMPYTSDCGVGTRSFWTRSASIFADDAWHCTGL